MQPVPKLATDLRRLAHLIALAEEGRFSRAAVRVHLSEAAFGRSIKSLEDQVGMRLFDRDAQRVSLTRAGQMVLERARALVFDSSCLQRDIELMRQGDAGEPNHVACCAARCQPGAANRVSTAALNCMVEPTRSRNMIERPLFTSPEW